MSKGPGGNLSNRGEESLTGVRIAMLLWRSKAVPMGDNLALPAREWTTRKAAVPSQSVCPLNLPVPVTRSSLELAG